MARVLFIDIRRTFVAENGEEEEEISGKGALEAEDEEDEDEYVEEEGNSENSPFEGAGIRVDV